MASNANSGGALNWAASTSRFLLLLFICMALMSPGTMGALPAGASESCTMMDIHKAMGFEVVP